MSAPAHRRPRRFHLRRPTWRGWFTIGLVSVVAGIVALWAIDYGTLGNRVARNVTVENVNLGRHSGRGLQAALQRADTEYGKGTVVFVVNGKDHSMSAAQIGLHLDKRATLAAARRVAREETPVLRPVSWLVSLFSPRHAPVKVTLDRAKLARALATLPGQTPVTEPRVVGSVDAIGTTAGADGYGFDPGQVARQIEAVARDGTMPLRVPLAAQTIEPVVPDVEVAVLASQARKLTARSIELRIPGASMIATPELLRSWITTVVPEGSLHAKLILDGRAVRRAARRQMGTIVTTSTAATFTVQNSQVLLVPQVNGTRCCSLSSGDVILQALKSAKPWVDLPLVEHPPTFTTAKARKLGITTLLGADEPAQPQQMWPPTTAAPATTPPPTTRPGQTTTSSTTTTTTPGNADSGQFIVPIPNRRGQRANVEQAIPLLRGRIIMPGKSLSLNSVIGAPSPQRHFVPADVATADGPTWISGGGTDLVAAALFEAAYESGLDIPTSTAHAALPDGVRPGIEATLGWTEPDLVIANPSHHAVLIWADLVSTGVRVQLFGTPFTTSVTTKSKQLPFGPHNACLAVNVKRTRTFTDGKTRTDTFSARYTPPPAARDDPNRVICPT